MKALLILFVLFSSSSWSKSFQIEEHSIEISVATSWVEAFDLYGIPLTLLGPSKDGKRPTLIVAPTGMTNVLFSQTEQEISNDYIVGRKKWLKKHNGNFLESIPVSREKRSDISESISMGYRYELGDSKMLEKTIYIQCKKKLFHLKYLLNEQQLKHINEIEEMIKSFKC